LRRFFSSTDVADMTCCRHCAGISLGATSYASTLVGNGSLLTTVESIEARIIPCVTAVCPACGRVSLLSNGTPASCVRTVAMWRRLAEWVDS
jgi:hypothetical protein